MGVSSKKLERETCIVIATQRAVIAREFLRSIQVDAEVDVRGKMSLRALDASGGADLDGSDADTKQDGFTPLKRCPGEINLTSAETYKERQRLLGLDALKFDVELSEASSGDHIGVLDDDAQRSVSMSGYLADDAADAGGVASRQHVSDEQDYAASQPQLNHLYRSVCQVARKSLCESTSRIQSRAEIPATTTCRLPCRWASI